MSHMEKGIIFVVSVLKDFLLAASLLKASDGINSKKFQKNSIAKFSGIFRNERASGSL